MIKKGEKPPAISAPVPGNMGDNRGASWMFNGRLSPVVPFAIRGAIWNQGWANRGSGLFYYNSLHHMIRGWRLVWAKPDLPVYFHQFYCPRDSDLSGKPSLDSTAEMRLGTLLARDIPNAGMACQIDIQGAIHYYNKALPGKQHASAGGKGPDSLKALGATSCTDLACGAGRSLRPPSRAKWGIDVTSGVPVPRVTPQYKPTFEFLPVWDFYPDMSAKTLRSMDGYFIRLVM